MFKGNNTMNLNQPCMIVKKTVEEWKLESVRASTLKEARRTASKARQKVIIKVGGLTRATIDGRWYDRSSYRR